MYYAARRRENWTVIAGSVLSLLLLVLIACYLYKRFASRLFKTAGYQVVTSTATTAKSDDVEMVTLDDITYRVDVDGEGCAPEAAAQASPQH
jgi:flagellar biogenesis protein FliO